MPPSKWRVSQPKCQPPRLEYAATSGYKGDGQRGRRHPERMRLHHCLVVVSLGVLLCSESGSCVRGGRGSPNKREDTRRLLAPEGKTRGKRFYRRGLDLIRRALTPGPASLKKGHPKDAEARKRRGRQRLKSGGFGRDVYNRRRGDSSSSDSSHSRSRSRSTSTSRTGAASRGLRSRVSQHHLSSRTRSRFRANLQSKRPSAAGSHVVRFVEPTVQEDREIVYVEGNTEVWQGRPMQTWLQEFHEDFKKIVAKYGAAVTKEYLYQIRSFWRDIKIRGSSLTRFHEADNPEVALYVDQFLRNRAAQAMTSKQKAIKKLVNAHPLAASIPSDPASSSDENPAATGPEPSLFPLPLPLHLHPEPSSPADNQASVPPLPPSPSPSPPSSRWTTISNVYNRIYLPKVKVQTLKNVTLGVAERVKLAASAIPWPDRAQDISISSPHEHQPPQWRNAPAPRTTTRPLKRLRTSKYSNYDSSSSEDSLEDFAPSRIEAWTGNNHEASDDGSPSKLWNALSYVGSIGGALKRPAVSTGQYLASKTRQCVATLRTKHDPEDPPIKMECSSSQPTAPPSKAEEEQAQPVKRKVPYGHLEMEYPRPNKWPAHWTHIPQPKKSLYQLALPDQPWSHPANLKALGEAQRRDPQIHRLWSNGKVIARHGVPVSGDDYGDDGDRSCEGCVKRTARPRGAQQALGSKTQEAPKTATPPASHSKTAAPPVSNSRCTAPAKQQTLPLPPSAHLTSTAPPSTEQHYMTEEELDAFLARNTKPAPPSEEEHFVTEEELEALIARNVKRLEEEKKRSQPPQTGQPYGATKEENVQRHGQGVARVSSPGTTTSDRRSREAQEAKRAKKAAETKKAAEIKKAAETKKAASNRDGMKSGERSAYIASTATPAVKTALPQGSTFSRKQPANATASASATTTTSTPLIKSSSSTVATKGTKKV